MALTTNACNRWQMLVMIPLLLHGYGCEPSPPSKSVGDDQIVGGTQPYSAILMSALNQDTLRDTTSYSLLEQWVELESDYPEWGALVGDSIEYTDDGILLWFHEPTGVSLCSYVFIADSATHEIVDGLRLVEHFDAHFSSHFYETKDYLRREDSVMIITSLMRYVKTDNEYLLPDEELEYERATVYVVRKSRFRRVSGTWRRNKSAPKTWEQYR